MNENATLKARFSGRRAAAGSAVVEPVSASFAMSRLSGLAESFFKEMKLCAAHIGSGSLWNDAHEAGLAPCGAAAFLVGAKENRCHAYR